MPPTLLSLAVGALVGVALLGGAFDRRSLAVVVIAAGLPDLDAVLDVVGIGATNATLHSVFVPLAAASVVYYDTEVRERSWIRQQFGWYGVRVAWVAIAAYAVAGIGPDLFSTESVALIYPLSDRYYALVGRFTLSTQDGIIQTYVGFENGWLDIASPGTVESHRIETWLSPAGEERRLSLIETGWQAIIVVTALAAVPAKVLTQRGDR